MPQGRGSGSIWPGPRRTWSGSTPARRNGARPLHRGSPATGPAGPPRSAGSSSARTHVRIRTGRLPPLAADHRQLVAQLRHRAIRDRSGHAADSDYGPRLVSDGKAHDRELRAALASGDAVLELDLLIDRAAVPQTRAVDRLAHGELGVGAAEQPVLGCAQLLHVAAVHVHVPALHVLQPSDHRTLPELVAERKACRMK